jgi:hypothetical protein
MKKKNPPRNLKRKISKLGPAIPGTIREVRLKCGKDGCRCQSGKAEDKHGPYYFWDRKVKGKLTSSTVAKDKVAKIKEMIENRRKFEKLFDRLLAQGMKAALREIAS